MATTPEVVKNSRKQLHSAALAIPFEERMRPQEPSSLLRIRSDKESSSPTPMTDVRGTLNSVLWDIPTIANQMSFKAREDPNATNKLLQAFKAHKTQSEPLLLFELTEFWGSDFDFIASSSSSRTPFVESSPAKQVPESTQVSERLPNLDSNAEEKLCRDCDQEGASSSTQPKETSRGKHLRLMKRQMKIESEAWQQAIQEYKTTLEEMCKNQLAPNLPFMKSMFLSWFEPLVNAITAEQEAYQRGDYRLNRSSYGPYLALLPADKLAVITMHKTVAKLLTEDANVGLRVVVPVLSIGEAVEQEVRI